MNVFACAMARVRLWGGNYPPCPPAGMGLVNEISTTRYKHLLFAVNSTTKISEYIFVEKSVGIHGVFFCPYLQEWMTLMPLVFQ